MKLCVSDLEEDERQPPRRLLYSAFKYTNLTELRLSRLQPRDKDTNKERGRGRGKVTNYFFISFLFLATFQPLSFYIISYYFLEKYS